MKQRSTLIINYPYMVNVGGIEKYIHNLTTYLTNDGIRVIWLCGEPVSVADSFAKVMLSNAVERIFVNKRRFTWFKHGRLNFSNDEKVVVLSFTPADMATSLSLAKEFSNININVYYCVPNTTGDIYFPERYFKGKKYELYKKRLGGIFQKWDEAGCLRFFSVRHADAIEKNYKFSISNKEEKKLKSVFGIPPLSREDLQRRLKRIPFNIITVGRFDYPHKGYMLGLVRAFRRLKFQYPQIALQIIGFGPDEAQLISEINKLPEDIRCDITLYGEIAPENVPQYMKAAHLNISVAGGVGSGATCGVLSIPARNYCNGECEVYGYLPEYVSMTTSTAPGVLVDSFIEEAINMDEQTYYDKCKASYQTYKDRSNVNPRYFLESNCCTKEIIDNDDIGFIKKLDLSSRIITKTRIIKKKLLKGFG